MNSSQTVQTILDSLAAQEQRGEDSLTIQIHPELVQDVLNLAGYRKLFVPVIAGALQTAQLDAMRQQATERTILVLVECQNADEFRQTVAQLPLRSSAEWRSFSGEALH